MSLLSLDRGLIPLGALLGGLLASTLGVRPGLFTLGSIVLVLSSVVLVFAGGRLAAIPSGSAVRGHPRQSNEDEPEREGERGLEAQPATGG